MGLDQRARQQHQIAAMRANYESRVGPIHDFGIHAGGCPACGFNQQRVIYCEGSSKLVEQPPDACPIGGEHLHVLCGRCQWEHLTKLRNDPSNPVLEENTCSLMLGFSNATLVAVLDALGGKCTVDEATVKANQEASKRVFVQRADGALRLSLTPLEQPKPAAE